jgi:hypothetical protein
LVFYTKRIKKESGGPEKKKKMLNAIVAGKNTINKRSGAPTTRGGTRPGGASEPRPTRLASTDTDTGSSDDGDSPKSGLTNTGPTIYPVALYVVARNGVVTSEHTGDTSLAGKLLDPIGYKVGGNVDMRDVGKLATTLNDDPRKVCVLVDVDSYTSGGIVKGLTAALPLIKREYMLIIKSTDARIMSDLEQINEYAVHTGSTRIDVNRIIRMEPRCVVIVHDSSSNPEDVWKLAYRSDASFYYLVGVDCGNIKDATGIDLVVKQIEHAFTSEPRPCKVIFQCANVGRFLVELHSTFLRFVDKTRALSLVDDANRSTGYAYNLYGHADAPGAKVATGPNPRYELVEHKPLKLATDENSLVVVISKAVPSRIHDPDGIYDENGAARTIRDARAAHKDTSGTAAPIAGGFKIHLTTVGSFPDIQTNFLVYADSGVTVKEVETATSKIKCLYRLLVMPLSQLETHVQIHSKRIETGKIIQMDPSGPSAAPLQTAAPVRETMPVPVPSSGSGSSGKHIDGIDPREVSTLVVVQDEDKVTEAISKYMDRKYSTETETYAVVRYDAFTVTSEKKLDTKYRRLVFVVAEVATGTDAKRIYETYDALVALADYYDSRTVPVISIVSDAESKRRFNRTDLVPYHLYSVSHYESYAGVDMYYVPMLSIPTVLKTAIVVIPEAFKKDPKFANEMVGKFRDNKPIHDTAMRLVLVPVQQEGVRAGALDAAVVEWSGKGLAYVLVIDETDASMDVLDTIRNEVNYNLFVVRFGEERAGRKDTKFSGWVRESAGNDDGKKNPIQNTILKKAGRAEMIESVLNSITRSAPIAHVVTGTSSINTLEEFRDKYDRDGKLRRFICGGNTHAFAFYSTLNAVPTDLSENDKKQAVLVIALPVDALDTTEKTIQLIKNMKCRVILWMTDKENVTAGLLKTQKYMSAAIKDVLRATDNGKTEKSDYIELTLKQPGVPANKFGIMGEFV